VQKVKTAIIANTEINVSMNRQFRAFYGL